MQSCIFSLSCTCSAHNDYDYNLPFLYLRITCNNTSTQTDIQIMFFLLFILVFPSYHAKNLQYYRGPRDKSSETFDAWYAEFESARAGVEAGLDLAMYYDVPEVAWASQSFVQPQLMVHDR